MYVRINYVHCEKQNIINKKKINSICVPSCYLKKSKLSSFGMSCRSHDTYKIMRIYKMDENNYLTLSWKVGY